MNIQFVNVKRVVNLFYFLGIVGFYLIVASCRDTDKVSNTAALENVIDPCIAGDSPIITELTVEENPNNVLSCFVSWKTDIPSTSRVLFGDEEYDHRVVSDELATEHRLLVIGMHAQTTYRIKAVSESSVPEGQAVSVIEYTTGSLPDIVPVASAGPAGIEHTNQSWTLLNIQDIPVYPVAPAIIVMYDDFGIPVWYFIDGESSDVRGDIDTRMIDDDVVLVGATRIEPAREVAMDGTVIWEGPAQPDDDGTWMHHHIDKLDDGNYIALRSDAQ